MINKLYGDGIHDDLPAIQEMLDSGQTCVYLPAPEKNYLIGGCIKIHSNQELKLDRFTKVVLKENSNCAMIKNAEPIKTNQNIKISGGIWDMNHNNQRANPWRFASTKTGKTATDELLERGYYEAIKPIPEGYEGKVKLLDCGFPDDVYTGMCFIFTSIKNFYIGNLTIVNPVVYGMDLYRVEDFTVENITFEYNEGSPKLWNLDGVHIEGYCKNGYVRNLKGACHDDAVALTSDDSYLNGPIENITIDGIYGQNSHSAVRILSRVNPIKNVHITNVYGSYYAYCVVLSKYSQLPERGAFQNITMDNIFASCCPGTVDVSGNIRPIIYIGENIDIKSLYISHLFRNETLKALPTIGVYKGTNIEKMHISCSEQSYSGEERMAFLNNEGKIGTLVLESVDAGNGEMIAGSGEIGKIISR